MIFALPSGFDFGQLLDFVFGSSASDVLFLKIGLWIILFAVLFKALEKTLNLHSGQAAILSIVISTISMRFMPVDWMSRLGTFIWVIVFIAVPYFFISALTQPGLWRWIIVMASYFGIFYSLANYESFAGPLGITEFIRPVFEVLAPVIYLVSDMMRLHPQQFLYVLGAVIALVIIVAIMKSKPRSEGAGVQQARMRPVEKKPSLLGSWLFGAGKKVAGSAGRGAAAGAKYMREDAKRTWHLWGKRCQYCDAPLVPGAMSCPKCGRKYSWRQRRWSERQVKVVSGEGKEWSDKPKVVSGRGRDWNPPRS